MTVPESEYLSPVWRDGIFNGRVVFVTGGAGTICSMQTRALVRLGANACILGRNVEKTEAAAKDIALVRPGAKVIGIGGCDVRNPEALKAAADKCAKELGGIDFVIAGAAGNFIAPIDGLSPNAFKSVIDIDVLGTFNTIKATIPHLLRSSSPRIVFVSATFHFTGMPLQSHGTEGLARLGSSKEEDRRSYVKSIPSGRLGTVRDIADATVFLFSEAGTYVNGQVIPVDGAAWRRQGDVKVGLDESMSYPEFLLSGDISKNLRDPRKTSKPKL
ncbi:unnamed protein product [Clonostachys rosea f. rosea IK726]|uniref:2,4-dienoyl-CoA reductase [(3E)-enoyl-CoA-producing] n=2 Tax=Bionectria ochroleuca TaxID=29856 RepID=A0A0B7JUF5_BIOOC|nr:unnamed protein product [Clonostachys rosea f. rosea IK726]